MYLPEQSERSLGVFCINYTAKVRGIYKEIRDVSAGATGATPVAPKFSDTLTLSQPGGRGRFCLPSQRSILNFPRDYVHGDQSALFHIP
jgi:hypothetical protein